MWKQVIMLDREAVPDPALLTGAIGVALALHASISPVEPTISRINGISEPIQIGERVDFDLFKISRWSLRLNHLEYEMRERWLDAPCARHHVRYHCATVDEPVRMRLADYVATPARRYMKLFPGRVPTIRGAVRRSANRHGRADLRGPGRLTNESKQ